MDISAVSNYMYNFYKVHADFAKEEPMIVGMLLLEVVIFLSVVPWGASFMLKANSVLSIIFGTLHLLFPQQFFSLMVNKREEIDALHCQEMRCIGIIFLALGLTMYLLQSSSDATVQGTLLMTITVVHGLLAVLDVHALLNHDKKSNMKYHSLNGQLHITAAWFVATLIYTLRQQDWGGYMEVTTACRNTHLRLDFIIWLAFGLVAFVFPKTICEFQVTSKMDPLHWYLARVMGIGFIGLSLMSGRACNFLREDDKKTVLASHALASVLFLGTMILCQIFTTAFTAWHALFGMVTVAVTGVNAIMGCDPRKLSQQCMTCLRKLVPSRKLD